MIASASDIRPPRAETLDRAERGQLVHRVRAMPDSTEPARKSVIALRYIGLRPKMSDSLPYSGVEIVP